MKHDTHWTGIPYTLSGSPTHSVWIFIQIGRFILRSLSPCGEGGGVIISRDAPPVTERPILLFRNSHFPFSFPGNDRFWDVFRWDTVTLCYGTQIKYWGFASSVSPFEKTSGLIGWGKSFWGTAAVCRGNPGQMLGLLILLVSLLRRLRYRPCAPT